MIQMEDFSKEEKKAIQETKGLKCSDNLTWLDKIPEKEKEAVKELKKRTISEMTEKMLEDPSLFYRFLKARDFNMKNAESMLRKHIAWRKEYNIDTLLTEYHLPEVLDLYGPVSLIGLDKEGSPVLFLNLGRIDDRGILNSAKKVDIIKHNLIQNEKAIEILRQENEKNGRLNTQIVYIYDFDKLTFSKATSKRNIELLVHMTNIYQDNYPERMKAVYFINTQFYFSLLFSAIRFVIASALMKKAHFFGKEGWKETLQETIPPDVLPAFLGGERTDPDGNPLCKNIILHETKIPERYYLSNYRRSIQKEPGVKELYVTRNKSCTIPLEVDEAGSYLEWEFENKNKDIGFAIYFKTERRNEVELEEIVPKQRICTPFGPETGVYKCERAGTYYLVFDNSFSWLLSKVIYYKVKVLPPKEMKSDSN